MRAALTLSLTLAGCAADECVPTPGPSGSWPELDDWLDARREADDLVGLAAVVTGPEGLVWSGGSGWEDAEHLVPVDPAVTMFRWASVAKGITGVVASSLAEDNLLNLHAEVPDLVPGYAVPDTWLDGCTEPACEVALREDERRMTLHHLLTHTAGVMHYANGQGSPVPPWPLTDTPLVNTGMAWALPFWTGRPLVAVPGASHNYSTFGYNLAGVAIEGATGEDFWDLARARAVVPSGACTIQPDHQWRRIPRRAVGYAKVGDVVVEDLNTDVSWKLAAGGVISTVEDFGRWCDALVHERVLPRRVLDVTAWAPHVAVPGGDYGYGFWLNERDGETHLAHSGGQEKVVTFLSIFPDSQTCFAVMSNSTWAPIGDIARALEDEWRALAEAR